MRDCACLVVTGRWQGLHTPGGGVASRARGPTGFAARPTHRAKAIAHRRNDAAFGGVPPAPLWPDSSGPAQKTGAASNRTGITFHSRSCIRSASGMHAIWGVPAWLACGQRLQNVYGPSSSRYLRHKGTAMRTAKTCSHQIGLPASSWPQRCRHSATARTLDIPPPAGPRLFPVAPKAGYGAQTW